MSRNLIALYDRRCGHPVAIHGDRAAMETSLRLLQPRKGWALRTRIATDADIASVAQGVRCNTCSVDGLVKS